jgi:hypothetical protein
VSVFYVLITAFVSFSIGALVVEGYHEAHDHDKDLALTIAKEDVHDAMAVRKIYGELAVVCFGKLGERESFR